MIRFVFLAVVSLWVTGRPSATQAAPVNDSLCAENEQTNALMCVRTSELKENGAIRSAPLWMGGPNGVSRSGYFVAANCSTGVMHLKDKDGVSFAGAGPGEGTPHSRQLRRLVCDARLPTPRKRPA